MTPTQVWQRLGDLRRSVVDTGCAQLGHPDQDPVTRTILDLIDRRPKAPITIGGVNGLRGKVRAPHRLRVYAAALRASGELDGLEKLQLLWDSAPADAETLALFPQLQTLNISRNRDLASLAFLKGAPQLRTLSIDLLKKKISLSPLRALSQLRRLNLNGCVNVDLSVLATLTTLEQLYLEQCAQIDATALSGLTNLHRLALTNTVLDNPRALRSLTKLAPSPQVAMQYQGRNVAGFFVDAGQHRDARLISLKSRWEVTDLYPLEDAPNVEELNLKGCRKLRDASPIALLPKLSMLETHRCEQLRPAPPSDRLEWRGAVRLYQHTIAAALDQKADRTETEARWLSRMRADGLLDDPPEAMVARQPMLQTIQTMLASPDPDVALQGLEVLVSLNDPDALDAFAWGVEIMDSGELLIIGQQRQIFDNRRGAWMALHLLALTGALQQCEQLRLRRQDQLLNLSPLRQATALTFLSLKDAHRIEDFSPLAGLKRLHTLELEITRRPKTERLAPLLALPSLTTLKLIGRYATHQNRTISGRDAVREYLTRTDPAR
ncbi:MAG: hypothetical protein AAFV53_08770 [Myxococcota bacterium]